MHLLVQKEMRPGHHIPTTGELSTEKKAKIRGFVKSYMEKMVSRYKVKKSHKAEQGGGSSNSSSDPKPAAETIEPSLEAGSSSSPSTVPFSSERKRSRYSEEPLGNGGTQSDAEKQEREEEGSSKKKVNTGSNNIDKISQESVSPVSSAPPSAVSIETSTYQAPPTDDMEDVEIDFDD